MKKGIHPEMKEATITCACGETFKALSTKQEINVEVCSKCHPTYTNSNTKDKKRNGPVDKFNKKYGLNN